MRRSRDYNGCWTCRQRKVKCDLRRPCCGRCEKAKLKCLGYKIILGWSPPLTVKENKLIVDGEESLDNFQRRNIDLVKFPASMYYPTYKLLNDKLDALEKYGGTVGPFSVYKLRVDRSHDDDFESSLVHTNLINYAKFSILAIKGISYQFNRQNMLHILYPKFFPNMDSDDWIPSKLILKHLFTIDDQLHLTPLLRKLMSFDSSVFAMSRVCFQPNYFDILVIPYLKLLILEYFICDFASWKDNPDNKYDSIKLAVVYLTLALSALSKSSKNIIELDLMAKLAIELRKIGLIIVNKHLDSYDDEESEEEKSNFSELALKTYEYEQYLLLAILLQIEIDSGFSVYENYELLYAIGDNIIKNKFKTFRLTSLTKFIINIFKISYIFFESTQSINMFNYEINEQDEIINYRDLNENYDLGDSEGEEEEDDDGKNIQIKPTIKNLIISNKPDYAPLSFTISFDKRDLHGYNEASKEDAPKAKLHGLTATNVPNFHLDQYVEVNSVYLMYGIPRSLLELFHAITHLTNHKNIFRRRRVFPRNFPRICAETYDHLLNWDINQYWSLDLNNTLHRQLHLYVNSFHKALIVYYNRLIQEGSIDTYQNYIIESLESLHELLSLKGDIRIRPTFWILFVCGSDVKDKSWQIKIEKLWNETEEFSQQYNYWRGKQILYEVWKRRDDGEDVGFMDIIREWDNILCLY